MATTIEIRDYAEIDNVKTALTEALMQRTLNPEQLVGAINSTDSAGYETIPASIGLDWLSIQLGKDKTRTALLELVPNMLDVYRACIGNHHIARVTVSPGLLQLVPESEREAFVRDVLLKHGAFNRYWIENAINVGVSRESLARIVLDLLRKTQPDDRGTHNFLTHDFLQDGAGRCRHINAFSNEKAEWRFEDLHTVWSVLTDDQLIEAMEICISKAPERFFVWRQFHTSSNSALIERLEVRLSGTQVMHLLRTAAHALPSLGSVSIEVFSRLSRALQQELVEKFKGGRIDLLVLTAVHTTEREAFFNKYVAGLCVTTQYLSSQFIALQPLLTELREDPNYGSFADHVDATIVTNLRGHGYRVGEIMEGAYKGRRQLCVEADGMTYVEDRRYQSRSDYAPKVGDRVVFRPDAGTRLGSATAVTFRLVPKAAAKK